MAIKTIKERIKNGSEIKLKITKHEIKYILSEVIKRDCYFPKINDQNFNLKESDTVIDIGANIGVFTVYAATLAKKGKIYAFEPVKDNFKRLEENTQINNLNNVVLEKIGISDQRKKVKIYLEKNNTGGHSVYKKKFMNPKTIRSTDFIEVIPLKDIFDKYKIKKCDFLKIDCEGSEFDVLKNLPDEYFKKIQKIVLEFHPNVDEIKLARFLIKKGFRVTINNLDGVLGMIFAIK